MCWLAEGLGCFVGVWAELPPLPRSGDNFWGNTRLCAIFTENGFIEMSVRVEEADGIPANRGSHEDIFFLFPRRFVFFDNHLTSLYFLPPLLQPASPPSLPAPPSALPPPHPCP